MDDYVHSNYLTSYSKWCSELYDNLPFASNSTSLCASSMLSFGPSQTSFSLAFFGFRNDFKILPSEPPYIQNLKSKLVFINQSYVTN